MLSKAILAHAQAVDTRPTSLSEVRPGIEAKTVVDFTLAWLYIIDRREKGLETEVSSNYHPCFPAVLIEAYF